MDSVKSSVSCSDCDSAWRELLINCNGKTISSDTIDNIFPEDIRIYTSELKIGFENIPGK